METKIYNTRGEILNDMFYISETFRKYINFLEFEKRIGFDDKLIISSNNKAYHIGLVNGQPFYYISECFEEGDLVAYNDFEFMGDS